MSTCELGAGQLALLVGYYTCAAVAPLRSRHPVVCRLSARYVDVGPIGAYTPSASIWCLNYPEVYQVELGTPERGRAVGLRMYGDPLLGASPLSEELGGRTKPLTAHLTFRCVTRMYARMDARSS